MAGKFEELADWLLFAAMELRPRLARRLLEEVGGPGEVLKAAPRVLERVEGVTPDVVVRIQEGRGKKDLSSWLDYSSRHGVQVVPFDSPWFPRLLNEIPDPPVALFVRGKVEPLAADAVAMVGTRGPTTYGRMIAEQMAAALARAGMTVVSGGAIGIDAAVHRGALSTGATVAVLGCGLDIRYPSANQELFDRVTQEGAVISEFTLGSKPEIWRFPARNRIISGITRATIVVEAAEKSGALITAGFAAEQGREVMAVPGPVTSAHSRGCHALIRDGATLVENAEQALLSLGWASTVGGASATGSAAAAVPVIPADLPLDQGMLLRALAAGQKHLDELTSECGLSAAQAATAITLLEMRGLVRRVPGNHFLRT